MARWFKFALQITCLVIVGPRAFADCTSPAAPGGAIQFFTPDLKFCDGTTWQTLATGGGGASGDFMADGTVAMTDNLRLGGQWLSNDGGDEGLKVTNAGDIQLGSTSRPAVVTLTGDNTTSDGLRFESSVGTAGRMLMYNYGNNSFGLQKLNASAALVFFDNSGNEEMRIASDGSVGIGGVTAPTQKLEVNGNILANGYFYSSDVRLKKNIIPLRHSLQKIISLSTVNFDWRQPLSPGAAGRQIGVIAQDVQKVYPEAVIQDQTGYLRVNYPALVAPTIDAVRGWYGMVIGAGADVAALENKITELEKKNHDLERRLSRIEKSLDSRQPTGE